MTYFKGTSQDVMTPDWDLCSGVLAKAFICISLYLCCPSSRAGTDILIDFYARAFAECKQAQTKDGKWANAQDIQWLCKCFANRLSAACPRADQENYLRTGQTSPILSDLNDVHITNCIQETFQKIQSPARSGVARETPISPTQRPENNFSEDRAYAAALKGAIGLPIISALLATPFFIIRFLFLKRSLSWLWTTIISVTVLVLLTPVQSNISAHLLGGKSAVLAAFTASLVFLIFKPSRSSRKHAARKRPSYHAPSSHAVTTLMGHEGVAESMSHSYPTGQSAEKDLILAAAKAERDKKIYFDKLQEALATHRSSSNSIQYFVHAAGAGTCAEIFATPTAGGTRNAGTALVAYETASEFAALHGIAASDLSSSVVGLIHDVAVHLISLFNDTSWQIDSAKTARYLANIYHDAGGLTASETEVIRALLAQKDNQYGAERANSEDELYAQAWKEVENGEMSAATWAKSFARAEGDPQKCKALYLSLRVAELRDERGR